MNGSVVITSSIKVCLLEEKLWDGFSEDTSETDQTCQKHDCPY